MLNRLRPRPRTFHIGRLELDLRATVALIATTLLLTIDRYHNFFPTQTQLEALRGMAYEGTLLFLLVPLLIILVVFGESPRRYGLTLGDWRLGLKLTAIVVGAVLPLVALAALTPDMRAYYAGDDGVWQNLLPPIALSLIGWEFLFRGFLIFSLVQVMGPTAIIVQAVPFALAHLGKPELETLTTIVGGSLFGWVAWRTRSFFYPYLIHLAIYTLTAILATTAAGPGG
jgi:membrane protease YdiL (CAAX protease family)